MKVEVVKEISGSIIKEGKRFTLWKNESGKYLTPKITAEGALSIEGLNFDEIVTNDKTLLLKGKILPADQLLKEMTFSEIYQSTDWPFTEEMMKQLDEIEEKLKEDIKISGMIPAKSLIMKTFLVTKPEKFKVLILGQDPYPRFEDAMGIAFSVPSGNTIPSSLKNIIKEVESDLGEADLKLKWESNGSPKRGGDLTFWSYQGVLLLNTALTVRPGEAGSHVDLWKPFTTTFISLLRPKVSLLWGRAAESFKPYISSGEILRAPHPSGLSASTGFFGCKHFSKANKILGEADSIKWVK
jgi:uracil-DNA glycosylase